MSEKSKFAPKSYFLTDTLFVHSRPKSITTMGTPTKPMTAREKIRKLVDVKEQVQREARERYQTDPEYRAVFENLRKENAGQRVKK